MRIALGLEYDGTTFDGWQSQPNGNTVQDKLQSALSQIAQQPTQVIAAGRTDAGVHAVAQVVHFDTEVQRPLTAWERGVNVILPPSIAVQWAVPVTEDFHARYSASSRRYHYVLYNHATRPALLNGKTGWFHLPLNLTSMQEATKHLIGEHDFSAFRSSECQAKTPIKTLHSVEVVQQERFFIFKFWANAFLHHMVRNIVGCLVYIGKGKYPAEWIKTVLKSKDRTLAAPTFSPNGLYLSAITYDPKWQIPSSRRMISPLFVDG